MPAHHARDNWTATTHHSRSHSARLVATELARFKVGGLCYLVCLATSYSVVITLIMRHHLSQTNVHLRFGPRWHWSRDLFLIHLAYCDFSAHGGVSCAHYMRSSRHCFLLLQYSSVSNIERPTASYVYVCPAVSKQQNLSIRAVHLSVFFGRLQRIRCTSVAKFYPHMHPANSMAAWLPCSTVITDDVTEVYTCFKFVEEKYKPLSEGCVKIVRK